MGLLSWSLGILTAAFLASTKTTPAAAMTIEREECRNGQFTLHYETDRNIPVEDIEWRIKFKDTEWMNFSVCSNNTFGVINCSPQQSKTLAVGIALLNSSNGAVTIASSRNSTHDYAQITCRVFYVGHGASHLSTVHYNVSFPAHCVRIQEGRDLNLTKISLEYSLPCERPGDIEDIEWYSIDGGSDGGSKFALCTSYQKCHIKKEHPVPPFWNRLRVITGSLFLTGIQSDDNKLKIGLKIFSKSCKTNMVEERVYIIWILVMSEQDSPVSEPNTAYTPPNLILPTSRTGKSSKSSNGDVSRIVTVLPFVSVESPTRSAASPSWSRGQLWAAIVVVTTVNLRTH